MGSPPHGDRAGPWLTSGIPVLLAPAADSTHHIGVHRCPVLSLLSSALYSWKYIHCVSPFHSELAPHLPGNRPSQATCMCLMTSLQGRHLPCPLECSRGRQLFRSETKEAHTSSLGLFYLSSWWLLRWSKVCFHYLIHTTFIIKTMQGEFSK